MSYLFYGGGSDLVAKPPTLATPWTAASQAPLPMGLSRQESWSGLPFPSPMCFMHSINSLYMSVQVSQFIPWFSKSVCLFPLRK